jgi:hypothetical protein
MAWKFPALEAAGDLFFPGAEFDFAFSAMFGIVRPII